MSKQDRTVKAAQTTPSDARTRLDELALDLHGYGFKRISLPEGAAQLDYEARTSDSCGDCASVWLGSKGGQILRVGVGQEPADFSTGRVEPPLDPTRGTAIREIEHVHRGPLGPLLLAGCDDGHLYVRAAMDPARPLGGCVHVEEAFDAYTRGSSDRISLGQGLERRIYRSEERFSVGVTTLSAWAAEGDSVIDCLVATRAPRLVLLRVDQNGWSVLGALPLPGWVDWIVSNEKRDEFLYVTRGGQLSKVAWAQLVGARDEVHLPCVSLSILPTAVLPLARGEMSAAPGADLLVGTTEGLFAVDSTTGFETALPFTKHGVTCLDRSFPITPQAGRAEARKTGDDSLFATFGSTRAALRNVPLGPSRRGPHTDAGSPDLYGPSRWPIDLLSVPLAVEILKRDTVSAALGTFLLVSLADHTNQLFRVESFAASAEKAREAFWQWCCDEDGEPPRGGWRALDHLEKIAGTAGSAAHAYLLAQVLLPEVASRSGDVLHDSDRWLTLLEAIAAVHDPKVLRALSKNLAVLATSARRVIAVSLALLRTLPAFEGGDEIVSHHLRTLAEIANATKRATERRLLLGWLRFVRKYVLFGNTFGAKERGLVELVTLNERNGKYLDALIYACRLREQRHEVSFCCPGDVVAVTCGSTNDEVLSLEAGGAVDHHQMGGIHSRLFDPSAPSRGLAIATTRGPDPWFCASIEDLGGETRARFVVGPADGTSLSIVTLEDHVVQHLVAIPGRRAFIGAVASNAQPLCVLGIDDTGEPTCKRIEGSVAPRGPSLPKATSLGETLGRPIILACAFEPDQRLLLVAMGDESGRVTLLWIEPSDWRVVDHLFQECFHPISALHLEQEPDVPGGPLVLHIATGNGEMFALEVPRGRERGGHGECPTPEVGNLHPLWRETHRGRVMHFSPMQLPRAHALVSVTDAGRVCLHVTTSFVDARSTPVSERNNFYFRGIRLDRIDLPHEVRAAIVLAPSSSAIGSSTSILDLLTVDLTGGLVRYRILSVRDAHPAITSRERLLEGVNQADLFLSGSHNAAGGADEQHRLRRIALCEVIRTQGGAVRRYAQGARFRDPSWIAPWLAPLSDASRALGREIGRILRALRWDDADERKTFKVLAKALSAHLFDVELNEEQREVRGWRALVERLVRERAGAADQTLDVLTELVNGGFGLPKRSAARVRIVVAQSVFRFPFLRQARDHPRLREGFSRLLQALLADDDRLVQVETLRSVTVALRNIRVLIERAGSEREAARKELLCDASTLEAGLLGLDWLLKPICAAALRHPPELAGSVVEVSWYHVSLLVGLIWLFPEHAVALCDDWVSRGVGRELLALVARRLRGGAVQRAREIIEHLYAGVLPRPDLTEMPVLFDLRGDDASSAFRKSWGEPRSFHSKRAIAIGAAFRRLGDLWVHDHRSDLQITRVKDSATPEDEIVSLLEALIPKLKIARGPSRSDRTVTDEFKDARSTIAKIGKNSFAAEVALYVLRSWELAVTPVFNKGDAIPVANQTLRVGSEIGSFGRVSELEGSRGERLVVKQCANVGTSRRDFLGDAHKLEKAFTDAPREVVPIRCVLKQQAAVIMPRLRGNLEELLSDSNRDRGDLAVELARSAGVALDFAHRRGLHHGHIHSRNVLWEHSKNPQPDKSSPGKRLTDYAFALSDFGAMGVRGRPSQLRLVVPPWLKDEDAMIAAAHLDVLQLIELITEVLCPKAVESGEANVVVARLQTREPWWTKKTRDLAKKIMQMLPNGAFPRCPTGAIWADKHAPKRLIWRKDTCESVKQWATAYLDQKATNDSATLSRARANAKKCCKRTIDWNEGEQAFDENFIVEIALLEAGLERVLKWWVDNQRGAWQLASGPNYPRVQRRLWIYTIKLGDWLSDEAKTAKQVSAGGHQALLCLRREYVRWARPKARGESRSSRGEPVGRDSSS